MSGDTGKAKGLGGRGVSRVGDSRGRGRPCDHLLGYNKGSVRE